MEDGTIDWSLLPEIRGRLAHVEKEFVTFAGIAPGQRLIEGVDLMAMKEKLSPKAFRLYIEVQRDLRAIENRERSGATT